MLSGWNNIVRLIALFYYILSLSFSIQADSNSVETIFSRTPWAFMDARGITLMKQEPTPGVSWSWSSLPLWLLKTWLRDSALKFLWDLLVYLRGSGRHNLTLLKGLFVSLCMLIFRSSWCLTKVLYSCALSLSLCHDFSSHVSF